MLRTESATSSCHSTNLRSSYKDGSHETRTSTLCEYGDSKGYSAIAKLVGVPCGVAVRQVDVQGYRSADEGAEGEVRHDDEEDFVVAWTAMTSRQVYETCLSR
jgi:outer membrane cobalamin receptor